MTHTRRTDSGFTYMTNRRIGNRCRAITNTCGPTMSRDFPERSLALAIESIPLARWKFIEFGKYRVAAPAKSPQRQHLGRLGGPMIRRILYAIAVAALSLPPMKPAAAQQTAGGTWRFVVSGDSRNCGDVVMPGIAETAKKNQAVFYWH